MMGRGGTGRCEGGNAEDMVLFFFLWLVKLVGKIMMEGVAVGGGG